VNLIPLAERLIVDLIPEASKTRGGIVLPEASKEKPQRAVVTAVGPGKRKDNGELIPMDFAVGDEIVFSLYGGMTFTHDGAEVFILREQDVLAKVVIS